MKKLSEILFKYRSYTPVPFVIVMLIFHNATITSMVTGFLIAILGEAFRFWGVSYAGSETRTTKKVGGSNLVISGPFAYVRNPLYLGNILIYLGIGIMSMALFPYLQIFALIYFYFQYIVIIKGEEEYLQKTYGKDYEEFKKNVPRFIPRLTPYNPGNIKQPPLNLRNGLRSERRTLQALTIVVSLIIIIFAIK